MRAVAYLVIMLLLERVCLWIVRVSLAFVLFTPLVAVPSLFFPFITGKAFFFRFFVELAVAAWCILICIRRDLRPRRSAVGIAALSFLLVIFVASVFGADFYHSFWSNFERMEGLATLLHIAGFFVVLASVFQHKKEWFYFGNISLGVSFAVAFYAFLQWRGIAPIIGEARIYSTLGNSIYLAVYLMFHFFITAIFALSVRASWARAVYGAIFLFEFFIFLIAASRGALIGLVVGVVFMAMSLLLLSRNKLLRTTAVSVIALCIVLGVVVFKFPQSSLVQKNEVLSRLSSVSVTSLNNDPRLLIWGIAVNAFKERPILGWGLENFVVPYAKYYDPNLFGNEAWFDRAHNMLLEWLVAGGLLGLGSYLAIFIFAGYTLIRLVRQKILDNVTAIIIGGFLLAYITQNIFVFDNVVTYIVVASVLAYVHSMTMKRGPDIRKNTNEGIIVGVIAVTLLAFGFVSYNAVARPFYSSSQIIIALDSLGRQKPVEDVIRDFEQAIAVGTFGVTEARERVADAVVQVAVSVSQTNDAFAKLLDFAIVEIEQEIIDRPASPRPRVFLGKLYTIRSNISGRGFEDAENAYQKALKISPNYIQNYLGLAELYLISGQKAKAVEAAKTAYSKPTKLSTLGSLFYPILSVYVLAERFDEAILLTREHRIKIQAPPLTPMSEDIPLLIARALTSSDVAGRARFFEALNVLIMEDYGFPDPLMLARVIADYQASGNAAKATALQRQFVTDTTHAKAMAYADGILKNNPEKAQRLVNKFRQDFDALR